MFRLAMFILLMNTLLSSAQNRIRGVVKEILSNQDTVALQGVNVYFPRTSSGAVTDEKGYFEIPYSGDTLYVSHIGYETMKVAVNGMDEIAVFMSAGVQLGEITISGNRVSVVIPSKAVIKSELLTTRSLQQLACCNLSESFENNASVDVVYTDAASGAKQIRMLGLPGVYTQMMLENIPLTQGISIPFGLEYIPGPWMESIQLSKGASAIVNGYESLTGQINIEMEKPDEYHGLFLNTYLNSEGRKEANLLTGLPLSGHLSSLLMMHGAVSDIPVDHNHDGFLDLPVGEQYNVKYRTHYSHGNLLSQTNIGFLHTSKTAGQKAFLTSGRNESIYYGMGMNAGQFQISNKTGWSFSKHETSIGWQNSFTTDQMDAFYGRRIITGNQKTWYSNLIFQSYFKTTIHKYVAGISYQYLNYLISVNDTIYEINERIPGTFFQYAFAPYEWLSVLPSFRYDYNSQYGSVCTPRIHIRVGLNKDLILRVSAGKGARTPKPFSEYQSFFASNRIFRFEQKLLLEQGWNYGGNLTYTFYANEKCLAVLSADAYMTEFINQLVADIDRSTHYVYFYNLTGRSFSESYQFNVTVYPYKNGEITTAYRMNNVKTTYSGLLLPRPLVSRDKALLVISLASEGQKWKLDLTNQYNGKSRLPYSGNNPFAYQWPDYSKPYLMLYAQITRKIRAWDFYAGVENLTGYTQPHPVIMADNPLGPYFDASVVYGPLTGRMFYCGLRFKIY